MDASNFNILVACEESQTVCNAFRLKGFNAYSCDLQECSGGHPEWHLQGDCRKFLLYDWDLVIAHPPCTYFSKANAVRLLPGKKLNHERYNKGKDMRSLFMYIYTNKCNHIAIENPTPLKLWALPKPNQIIQPYEFGHHEMKRTCLWLKNLPPLMSTDIILDPVQWVIYTQGSKARSKTFQGIADAMADQWGDYLLNEYKSKYNGSIKGSERSRLFISEHKV